MRVSCAANLSLSAKVILHRCRPGGRWRTVPADLASAPVDGVGWHWTGTAPQPGRPPMPDTDRQAIALRLAVLQAKRTACLEKLASERTWRNEHLAGHEEGLLAAFDWCILNLVMERQAVD